MPAEDFEAKHLKSRDGYKRTLRHKKDPHFGKICKFFDTKARNCTVYKARPGICRQFPAEKRCGYYDFLKFERRHQEDPDFVATTNHD
jgi:Fe-S-cluster containining protein